MKHPATSARRKFLLGAGLGGASGYRVTAHIEKYYKTTGV
jgi:hypothetical protein